MPLLLRRGAKSGEGEGACVKEEELFAEDASHIEEGSSTGEDASIEDDPPIGGVFHIEEGSSTGEGKSPEDGHHARESIKEMSAQAHRE